MALWAFWCVWQGVTLSAWCRLCGVSVSGVVLWLSVWLSGGLLWLWWSLVWLCVSGGLCGSSGVLCVVLCLWCCRAVWCRSLLWWSGVLSSGLWWCLLWSGLLVSGVWYIISSALNFYAHEKSATLHDTLPLAYHTINFSSDYSITNFFTPSFVFPNFFSLVFTPFSGVLGVSISTFCTGVFFMIFLVLLIGLLCLMTSSKSLYAWSSISCTCSLKKSP